MEVDAPEDAPLGRCAFPQVISVAFSNDIVRVPVLHVGSPSIQRVDDKLLCVVTIEDTRIADLVVHSSEESPNEMEILRSAVDLASPPLTLIEWWTADEADFT
jgi:hypothetical protein